MKRYIPVATMAVRVCVSSIQNEKPVQKRKMDISGNVVRRRLRRPKVSIVYTAGRAKIQFVIPQPSETSRASRRPKPAFRNMEDE